MARKPGASSGGAADHRPPEPCGARPPESVYGQTPENARRRAGPRRRKRRRHHRRASLPDPSPRTPRLWSASADPGAVPSRPPQWRRGDRSTRSPLAALAREPLRPSPSVRRSHPVVPRILGTVPVPGGPGELSRNEPTRRPPPTPGSRTGGSRRSRGNSGIRGRPVRRADGAVKPVVERVPRSILPGDKH